MRYQYRLSLVIALLLLGIAVVVGLFDGPLTEAIQEPVEAVVSALPNGGRLVPALVLAGGGAFYLYDQQGTDSQSLVDEQAPPERPRNAPELVGTAFETRLDDAATDVSFAEATPTETEPYETLREAARRALQLRQGYTPEKATEELESGRWTDDPVARAFLSESIEYPVEYQFLRWARPGQAYELAVERTSNAVRKMSRPTEPTAAAAETGGFGLEAALRRVTDALTATDANGREDPAASIAGDDEPSNAEAVVATDGEAAATDTTDGPARESSVSK